MKRPILVSLAAVTLSLGLVGSFSARAATSNSPTAATTNPANDHDLGDLAYAGLERPGDTLLFHHHDDDGDDGDGDDDGRSRCSGVIAICLG